MEFMDQRRTDTGGSVPDLRNVTVSKTGPTLYRVVDEFFNGMIRGQVYYTLRLVDRDHIEINFDASGHDLPAAPLCALALKQSWRGHAPPRRSRSDTGRVAG